MNKLVSKNSVLRFKLGKLILKFLNGLTIEFKGKKYKKNRFGTAVLEILPDGREVYAPGNLLKELIPRFDAAKQGYYNRTNEPTNYLSKPYWKTEQKTSKQTSNIEVNDYGFPKKDKKVVNPRGSNKPKTRKASVIRLLSTPIVEQPTSNKIKSFDVGTLNPTTGEFTPNGSTYQDAREAVKSTVAELNPPTPEYMDAPGIYTIGTTLNSGNVRSNRNLYRNVDEYYDWLNTDAGANSDDYKLFANTGLWAPNISEENRRAAFNEIMNKWGISGNLGRRDSGRLANLLNSLSLLGSDTKTREAFIDSYNNKLDLSLKSNNSEFYKTQNFGLTTPQFTTYTPSSDFTKNLTMLNADLKYNMKFEKGGLISKNPVERFKSKSFRREAL